jgi:hypothetical protein
MSGDHEGELGGAILSLFDPLGGVVFLVPVNIKCMTQAQPQTTKCFKSRAHSRI